MKSTETDAAAKELVWPPHFTEAGQEMACRRAGDRRGPYVLSPQRGLAERVTQRAASSAATRGNPRPVAGVRSPE